VQLAGDLLQGYCRTTWEPIQQRFTDAWMHLRAMQGSQHTLSFADMSSHVPSSS